MDFVSTILDNGAYTAQQEIKSQLDTLASQHSASQVSAYKQTCLSTEKGGSNDD